MDSSSTSIPNCSTSDFSSESTSFEFDYLPFNENDPEEMLLYGMINDANNNTTNNNTRVKEEERKHSLRRKIGFKKNKEKDYGNNNNSVVFEDLGSDYLEQLLMSSDKFPCTQ
ncbi:hypothetical protein TSUD_27490 [Trifolium subterraneum]|uniref:Uncharacterized protein n=1 Tax=Trifolium subterraneum TaxID=3900 RepID=A0A2Z6P6H4_TRISU|nr:hypothetical protein TSUD_27490 [Trifolium subterraneum]